MSDLSRVVPRNQHENNVAFSERCACGAEFEALYPFQIDQKLEAWRRDHRHDMAAAIERERAAAQPPTPPTTDQRGASDE